jgi:hypothetical protein
MREAAQNDLGMQRSEGEARHCIIKHPNANEYSDKGFRINTKGKEPQDYDAV